MIREILIYTSTYLGLFILIFYLLSIRKNKERKVEYKEHELPSISINLIKILKDKYNVERYDPLVVNGEKKLTNIKNISELEDIFD